MGRNPPTKAVTRRHRSTARLRVEVISRNITRSRRLTRGCIWVINREVHVAAGVTLTIADGATILLVNGVVPSSRIRRSALLFDPGSQLRAGRFTVRAAGADHRPVKLADNGGIWFLGTLAAGEKDLIRVKKVKGQWPSLFKARSITASYLGRADTYRSQETGRELDIGDDIDGVSLIGVGLDEWKVSEVRSLYSADDGIDLTNSHIRLDRLEVRHPIEDGMNITSSRIEVRRSLVLEVVKTRISDRDLFDLETDDGASYVELPRGCWVRVRGVFGDQLRLTSSDMPRPVLTDDNERDYRFSGKLKVDALIHSISED